MERAPSSQHDLTEIEYVILPGKLPTRSSLVELHNRAYEFWRKSWRQVFLDNGVLESTHFEEAFCRAEVICLLMHKKQIIGLHLCEFLNLNLIAFRQHEYFSHPMGVSFLEALDRKRIQYALAMTYLTVDPEWRKRRIGISLASVLMSLVTKLQGSVGVDVNLGRAREDVGVHNILIELGGTVLHAHLPMHNTPVSIICIFTENVKSLSDPVASQFTEFYWHNRTDHLGYSRLTQIELQQTGS
jgi:hypothetical protein